MPDLFLVTRRAGPQWDRTRARREQAGWDEHAAFMDRLVEEGFVVLGGPVGEVNGDDALVAVRAADEAEVRERLRDDPWGPDMLTVEDIRPWHLWMRGELPRD